MVTPLLALASSQETIAAIAEVKVEKEALKLAID
jgi:hypothetical protein